MTKQPQQSQQSSAALQAAAVAQPAPAPVLAFCFDPHGGFYAADLAAQLVEYAYPSSAYATEARKHPEQVAAAMLAGIADFYRAQPWHAERWERMRAQMAAADGAIEQPEPEPESWHPVRHFGEPKHVPTPVTVLHVFEPDASLYCNLCGAGELQGNHGIAGLDHGQRVYESVAARVMYEEPEQEPEQAAEPAALLADWRYEVANGDTQRGFAEWCAAQVEAGQAVAAAGQESR